MAELFRDLFKFMGSHKKFWLLPLVLTLVAIGALIVFTQGSVVAPFIYTLF